MSSMMTPPRGSSPTRRRSRASSAIAITRAVIQRNCRGCHEQLSSAFDRCWTCNRQFAGIRWMRLVARVAVVVAALAGALVVFRSLAG